MNDGQYLVFKNVFALNKGSKPTSRIILMTKDTIMNFTDKLKNESCNDTFLQEDINKSFNPLWSTFYISFGLCFPMQHVTTKLQNNCWLTKEIRVFCKWKKNLYILSRNSNYSIIKAYIECCSILRKIIWNAKQTHYNCWLVSAGYKSITTWNI